MNPTSNVLKVIVSLIVLGGIGYFAYTSSHKNSPENTGVQADSSITNPASGSPSATNPATGSTGTSTGGGTTSTGTGKSGPGITGGATGIGATSVTGSSASGRDGKGGGNVDPICNNTTVITLDPSADNATFGGGPLWFDNNYQDGGHFIIENPSQCPVTINTIVLSLVSTAYPATTPSGDPAWTPIGGVYNPSGSTTGTIKLHVGISTTPHTIPGTSPLGVPITHTFYQPNGPLFGSPILRPTATPDRSMTFTSAAGITIPAYGSQSFALEISTWNMPPPDPASGISGDLNIMLRSITAVSSGVPSPYTWTVSPATMASVSASPVTITLP